MQTSKIQGQKLRPILFTTDMVRAILDGRKTQTRRIKSTCEVGDVLWVRETWRVAEVLGKTTDENFHISVKFKDGKTGYVKFTPDRYNKFRKFIEKPRQWFSSIYMPREACRLYLQVEAVREERVQSITLKDIEQEGLYCDPEYTDPKGISRHAYPMGMRIHFSKLWDSINAKRGYGWDSNPIVKVIEFRRVKI